MKVCKIVIFLCILLFISCDNTVSTGKPSFVLSKPECIIGKVVPSHAFAGIHFTITNTATKKIKSIEVSCIVYEDMEGTNPFIGNNNIEANFIGTIEPNTEKKLVLSLDNFLYTEPTEPYIIDYFYVKQIVYEDNTKWKDPFGTYFVRSY